MSLIRKGVMRVGNTIASLRAAAPSVLGNDGCDGMRIATTNMRELLMAIVRIQPRIRGGKAALSFRNGLEDAVTVTRLRAASHGTGGRRWITLLSAPLHLRPGQIEIVDISSQISKLFKPVSPASLEVRHLRVRVAMEPMPPNQPEASEYWVSFQGENFIRFSAC